ncbi:MAG: hypothetical protein ACLP01_24860 [Solirubrobacteraceae bacterium]
MSIDSPLRAPWSWVGESRVVGSSVIASGSPERAAYNIVTDLAAGGYITRERHGRRNSYTIHDHLPLPDRLAHKQRLGDLLAILTPQDAPTGDSGGRLRRERVHET